MTQEDIERLKKNKFPDSDEPGVEVEAETGAGTGNGTSSVPPRRTPLPTVFGGYEYSPAEQGAEAFGGSEQAPEGPVDPEQVKGLVTTVLKDVYDPEIPVNIYDLGLIYDLAVSAEGDVEITMTLTAPGCPVAGSLVQEVAERVGAVEGVRRSHVQLVFEPPWDQDRMTEEARLELGLL